MPPPGGFFSQFFMPRCGATFDEKRPPLDKGGLQGGFERWNKPTRALRAAVAVVRFVADEHGTPTTPAVAVGPGIPSSTEEGSSFSEEFFMPSCGATFG